MSSKRQLKERHQHFSHETLVANSDRKTLLGKVLRSGGRTMLKMNVREIHCEVIGLFGSYCDPMASFIKGITNFRVPETDWESG
jgi:hypothetical protein